MQCNAGQRSREEGNAGIASVDCGYATHMEPRSGLPRAMCGHFPRPHRSTGATQRESSTPTFRSEFALILCVSVQCATPPPAHFLSCATNSVPRLSSYSLPIFPSIARCIPRIARSRLETALPHSNHSSIDTRSSRSGLFWHARYRWPAIHGWRAALDHCV